MTGDVVSFQPPRITCTVQEGFLQPMKWDVTKLRQMANGKAALKDISDRKDIQKIDETPSKGKGKGKGKGGPPVDNAINEDNTNNNR